MSLSREALLGAVLIVVVTVLFSKRRLLALAIGAPLLLIVPFAVPAIGARMSDAFSTGGAGRTSIWAVGWQAFKMHPWFGWGAGAFDDAYDKNYLSVYQFYNAGWSRASHNSVLHTAVEMGTVGLVLMVLGYLLTFRQFRGIPPGSSLWDLRVALTGALIALGFVALFIDLMNYKYLWVVLCAIAQLRAVARRSLPEAQPVEAVIPPAVARAIDVRPARARA